MLVALGPGSSPGLTLVTIPPLILPRYQGQRPPEASLQSALPNIRVRSRVGECVRHAAAGGFLVELAFVTI